MPGTSGAAGAVPEFRVNGENMTSLKEIRSRRAHKRVLVANAAAVAPGGDSNDARILSISAVGAGLRLDVRLEDQTTIAVEIEDTGLIPARVVRQMRCGVRVRFELSPEKEQRFLRQISKIVAEKRKMPVLGTA